MTTATGTGSLTPVGTVNELEAKGCVLVSAGGHAVAVFAHEGRCYALDNRCPHMGFPLNQGSLRDGLLTCHWHHARFDLASGGTLDPFADDVRAYPVIIRDGEIFIDTEEESGDRVAHWERRLAEGMEQRLSLVLAKAVLGLLAAGVSAARIAALGGQHGLRYRQGGWSSGMTILTAMASIAPVLAPEDRVLALVHGLDQVASDCAGRPPRFGLEPLPAAGVSLDRLKGWLRRAVAVRDEEGSERALATAIAAGAAPADLADLLFSAATDHVYLDDGHTLDFINKACEYLDLVGWEQAGAALPSLVAGLCRAGRAEERNAWRYPIDLIALIEAPLGRLQESVARQIGSLNQGRFDALVATLLGDDPAATVTALEQALDDGVALVELGSAVAHASALRVARFHTSNEFGDWDTVHNTWTSCQALDQALRRAPSAELARGLYHAAMRIYLDRFLNIPAQRLPDTEARPPDARSAESMLAELTDLLDREQQVNPAGRLIDGYLAAGHDPAALIRALGHVTLREDADFHAFQTLEAGWRQFDLLRSARPLAARRTLMAVGRYLAAHSPTSRALRQTATIAVRLARGEELFAEAAD